MSTERDNGEPSSPSSSVTRLVEVPASDLPDVATLLEELRRRWASGERPVVEEFLRRHPALEQHPGAILKLISEEFRLRRGSDGEVDPTEYLRRFPAWQSQLEVLLSVDTARASSDIGDGPHVGDRLGDFELLAE